MNRKSKFRMTFKSHKKSKRGLSNDLPSIHEMLHLKLSPETQTYVQCRIGDQIFGDNNWVFVLKSDILSSVEVSDDFLPVLDIIKVYPEDKMLIGSYGFDQSISEEFQLCTTVKSKNNTLIMIERRIRKIKQIFDMPVYEWISMGSEVEVLGMQNINLRTLYKVEIESDFPIFLKDRIFSIQEANENGYAECFATRHEYKNVWRRRIDVACQARARRKNASSQTRTCTDLRHFTQYEQQIRVGTPDTEICERIAKLLDSLIDDLEDVMQINYHIHLHTNDYEEFLNPYVQHVYTHYKEIVACQDIKNCQGKQVSCVSWSPFISGLFAASYVCTIMDYVNTSEPQFHKKEVPQEHVALVWSFSDMQKPKLYLHSAREVTHISFCPYDENIIVGGCSNGQIIVWDIRGQLSKVETKVVLSPSEHENQMKLANLVLWMKKLPTNGHVNASVLSSLQYGHKTAITSISWIPPEYFISTTGQFTKSPDDNLHMQFVTTSLEDGYVCVWDLKHYHFVKNTTRKRPLQRLSKLPSALQKDVSPLKKKLSLFIPIFMLFVKDSISHKPIHLKGMIFKKYEYQYEETKSVKVDNDFKRRYFQLAPDEENFDCEQSFVVNTVSGIIHNCTWEGFSYDHGNKVNFDSCVLESRVAIHDAPIKMCIVHKEEPNVYLSIGGKVFAIWHRKQLTPILWRKCESNFIFGKWSYVHQFELLLFTNDGFIQLWNFLVNSKCPIYIVRSHGLPPQAIFSNAGVEHYIRNALLLLDRFGAIRIHSAGKRLAAKSVDTFRTYESLQTFIETKNKCQECVAYWSKYIKSKQCAPEEIKKEIVQVATIPEKIAADKKDHREKPSEKQMFEKREHDFMYKQLTECKGIQLKQLEINKNILDQVIIENNELGRKCEEALKKREEVFEKIKQRMTWKPKKIERKIFRISMSKEHANNLKKQYLQEYLLLEKELAKKLQEFKFVFDWRRIEVCKFRSRTTMIDRLKSMPNQTPVFEHHFAYNIKDSSDFTTFTVFDT